MASLTLQVVIFAAGLVAGLLSLYGSLGIICNLLKREKGKLKSSYDRILFCMSFMDIIQSLSAAAGPLPVPYDTPGLNFAIGNTTTCDIQGFSTALGAAVPLYNLFLSLHFLLAIRYEAKEVFIKRKIEPFMHLFGLGYPTAVAIGGQILGVYNFSAISPYPYGCYEKDPKTCTRGVHAYMYRWINGFLTMANTFLIPCIMGVVIFTVWRAERNMKKLYGRHAMTVRKFARTKAVAKQGLLYSAAYIVCWILPIIGRLSENYMGRASPPAVIVVWTFLYPLQGFFNYTIYIGRQYFRVKGQNPDHSRLWVLYQCTFYPEKHKPLNISYPNTRGTMRSSTNTNASIAQARRTSRGTAIEEVQRVECIDEDNDDDSVGDQLDIEMCEKAETYTEAEIKSQHEDELSKNDTMDDKCEVGNLQPDVVGVSDGLKM